MGQRIKKLKQQKANARLRGKRAHTSVIDDAWLPIDWDDQSGRDPELTTYEGIQAKLAAFTKEVMPSAEFHCPDCMTCLICFQELRGKKIHTNPCNYGCGLDPSDDIHHECDGKCGCKKNEEA